MRSLDLGVIKLKLTPMCDELPGKFSRARNVIDAMHPIFRNQLDYVIELNGLPRNQIDFIEIEKLLAVT